MPLCKEGVRTVTLNDMKQKKVLHISNYYAPHIGGIEDVCQTLVNGMRNQYHERVVCFNDKRHTVETYDNGIPVIHAGAFCKIANQSFSYDLYKILKEQIRTYRPDILHVHMPNPLIAMYVLLLLPKRCKLVVHWHSDIVEQRFLYYFVRGIERALLRKADKILVTTPNYIAGSKPLARFLDKIDVLPCAISSTKLDEQPGDTELIGEIRQRYAGKPIIFFMGRHVAYKGIDYLIKAERLIRNDCVVLIAGSGPNTGEMKKLAAGRERIHFLGRIPDDKVRLYMRAAQVFAFPSITKNEAFGIALAEAMYCGLPPVTFTISGSGVNWVSIADETGLEVPNRSVERYAEAIDKLLSDEKLRMELAEGARLRAGQLMTVPVVCKEALRVYREL